MDKDLSFFWVEISRIAEVLIKVIPFNGFDLRHPLITCDELVDLRVDAHSGAHP